MERHTLAEQVYALLKKGILEGDLLPGERLKESEIAESLGASRTPVREALTKLELEGLLEPLPSGGLTVVELSEEDVREIFGLIRVLESHAARLAVVRAHPDELEALEELCQRAERTKTDASEIGEINRRFHEKLIALSKSGRLQDILGKLRAAMQPYRIVSLDSSEFRTHTVRDHRAIVECLRSRDEEALGRLVEDHLRAAERRTLEAVRAQSRRMAELESSATNRSRSHRARDE